MDILPHGGVIYIIHNTKNDTVYVGQTITSPQRRWQDHQSYLQRGVHKNPHLQFAWNKYGATAFEFCVLEILVTIEETNEAEYFYIEYFHSIGVKLYNCTKGGRNARHSEETKAKLRILNTGRKHSAEAKAKTGAASRGRKRSAEAIARASAANTGRKMSAEAIAKSSAGRRGQKRGAEAKAKMRAAKLGRKASDETRAKMSATHLARFRKNIIEE